MIVGVARAGRLWRVSRLLHPLLFLIFACTAYAQEAEPRFAVTGFQIEGELPIPRERAMSIVAPFAGDAIELGQLQKAATALEQELFARGHTFYRVIVPPQDLAGVVTLRVLPFRLANVTVKGNQYFSEENILRSLPSLKKGASPNVSQVGRNRSAANEHPSKEVEITFRESETPDSVDAEVAVLDQQPQSFFIGLNNIGERRTGHYRARRKAVRPLLPGAVLLRLRRAHVFLRVL
jgi:hemolysin activation/secretion protein